MADEASGDGGSGNAGGTVSAPTSNTLFTDYAEYVHQVVFASQIGKIPTIPNPLARGDEPAILVDPEVISAYRVSIADQLNAGSQGPTFEDLSERIADIIIETSAQGASTLEVHLIDPAWIIPMSGFITVDETGYLWPPIEVNFPSDTDCTWRLVQYAPTWGQNTEANLVLTFEDKIVSLLREMSAANGGVQQGAPNQTLGMFIQQLIDSTNNTLKTNLRLVELISPKDPNATLQVTDLPASAKGNLRKNPTKAQLGLTDQMNQLLGSIDQHQLVKPGERTSIARLESENRTFNFPFPTISSLS